MGGLTGMRRCLRPWRPGAEGFIEPPRLLGLKGLGLKGLGFRGLGFRGLGLRVEWFRV